MRLQYRAAACSGSLSRARLYRPIVTVSARLVLLGAALAAGAASAALVAASLAGTARATAAGPYGNGLVAYAQCCGPAGIYVIRPDGSGRRLLFRAVHDDAPLTPAWAPDGKRIAFVPGAPRRGVWLMSGSGTGLRRVTAGRGDTLFPSWSPQGSALVFADVDRRRSGRHDLFIVRADGTAMKRLTSSGADEAHPAWAPNGNEIVYERGRDLWRMRADGRNQRLLIRNAGAPSWSPGGSRIAFIRGGDVWNTRRDGSGAVRVADLPRAQADVAWSPDSRWLLTAPLDRGDLTLTRADGLETKPLTRQADAFHAWPSWQRIRTRRPTSVSVLV
jgi:Tol biopolymer transport system component